MNDNRRRFYKRGFEGETYQEIVMTCIFTIAFIVLAFLFGCDGAGKTGAMELNEDERLIWDLTVECLVESAPEDFGGKVFTVPEIRYEIDPCGNPNYAGCAFPWDGYIEVDTFYYNYNDGNGYDDGDGTAINEGLYVHEFKHVILWQAGLDDSHDSYYYGPDTPCPDGFLIGRIGQ